MGQLLGAMELCLERWVLAGNAPVDPQLLHISTKAAMPVEAVCLRMVSSCEVTCHMGFP